MTRDRMRSSWSLGSLLAAILAGLLWNVPASRLEAGDAPCAEENCDTNGDARRDISDGILIFTWLFLGGLDPVEFCSPEVPVFDNGDCNGDDKRDISDGIRLLSFLFTGGDPPVPAFVDPDTDADGVLDRNDNCPLEANAGQEDTDADLVGDVCDVCPGGNDASDGDGDGVADFCDNCPSVAASDQADTDADGVGDPCDNCPSAANADQADADGDGTGDACEQPSGTYAGSLVKTRGRWNYNMKVGLAGANDACDDNFPGSQVCTDKQLLVASQAGELAGAHDSTGTAVVSFWVHRPGAPGARQCLAPDTENINWTYQTGHIAQHGEFVTLDPAGKISEIQLVMDHCQASRSVACCNPAP